MTVMQFDGKPHDVAAILIAALNGENVTLVDPGEKLEGPAVVTCETMAIATIEHIGGDQFSVHSISCYAPVHGSHPRHAAITAQLSEYNDRQNKHIICPVCSGKKWLHIDGNEAKTAVSFAISLGIFRGVNLPKTEEMSVAQDGAMEKAFSNVLSNPLVTRVQAMTENLKAGADG